MRVTKPVKPAWHAASCHLRASALPAIRREFGFAVARSLLPMVQSGTSQDRSRYKWSISHLDPPALPARMAAYRLHMPAREMERDHMSNESSVYKGKCFCGG